MLHISKNHEIQEFVALEKEHPTVLDLVYQLLESGYRCNKLVERIV